MVRPQHLIFPLLLASLLSACINLGPDYQRPAPEFAIPAAYQNEPNEVLASADQDHWWKTFGNPEINRIVGDVVNGNLDIRRATEVVMETQSRMVQTRADQFPRIGIQGQVQRQKSPETIFIPGFAVDRRTTTYNLSLPASFEVDLWGRLAKASRAARADLLRVEENRRTIIQSLIAESVSLYLQMEALERRIQITEQSIQSYKRSVQFVEGRYEKGLAPVLDLRQARRTLTQAEAGLPQLKQDLGVIQHRLAVLIGQYPTTHPARSQPEDYYKPVGPVPQGLPSELLSRRPDIRAAEANLMALNARVGVAKASRFPSISLTGNLGYSSTALDDLFDPQSEIWSLATGILQPVFDAGKLKAGQEAAEARYRQGVAEYAKTVLTAFAEVENALLTRKRQLEKRNRTLNFLEEARETQRLAEARYNRGLSDYLTVLNAQQIRFVAENSLVLVDLTILTNRVALHRALGGGWGELTAETGIDEEKELSAADSATKQTRINFQFAERNP